jgi:hypothetical protein
MKEKTFDLQDRFVDFAVMNSYLEIGYSSAVDRGEVTPRPMRLFFNTADTICTEEK